MLISLQELYHHYFDVQQAKYFPNTCLGPYPNISDIMLLCYDVPSVFSLTPAISQD